ncbi:MAG TPA: hypothetical protein VGM16_11125, partial [Gammaproteobacteria bacterium]
GFSLTVRDRSLASVEKADAIKYLSQIDSSPYVYVNPDCPSVSYLMGEIEFTHLKYLFTYMGAGLLLFLIGIGIFFISP